MVTNHIWIKSYKHEYRDNEMWDKMTNGLDQAIEYWLIIEDPLIVFHQSVHRHVLWIACHPRFVHLSIKTDYW